MTAMIPSLLKFRLFRLALIAFLAIPVLPFPAQAQTAPDPDTCVQKGGRLLCVDPLVGDWTYRYQRCDGPNPAPDEASAITQGAAQYYSGCGGDQMVVNVSPWGTDQAQTSGSCGSSALYPMYILGIEYANSKGVNVRYCFNFIPGGSIDGFNVFRQRTVVCPDGYYGVVYPDNSSYCAPTISTKCPTCDKNSSDNRAGNPIDLGNGNKIQVETDYRAAGSLLAFSRSYNSLQDSVSGRMGRKWTHNFDRRLTISTTPAVVFAYRGDGAVYTHWKAGGVWTTDPDVNDRIAPILDGGGATTGWRLTLADDSVETYSTGGRLLTHTTRGGMAVNFTYSDANTPIAIAPAPGLLIGATDSFGKSLAWTYDSKSRIATLKDADNQTYTYSYDADNNLISVAYPDSKVRGYLYNEAGLITGVGRPNQLTGIQDENNARFASFSYDSLGNGRSTEHAGGVSKYITAISFANNTASVTDPLGTVRSYSFTPVQGVFKFLQLFEPCPGCTAATSNRVTNYDGNGNIAVRTDTNGQATAFSYDLTRNLELSRTEASGTPQARTITTTWHPAFRLPATITEPTTAGNKVTTFTHDTNGNVLTRSVAVGGSTRTWTYTYDSLGRVLTATDPRGKVTTNVYYPNTAGQNTALPNSRGMLNTVTNAAGHVTTITGYNAHGQPLSITDPNGLVTTLTYDARQRIKTRNLGGETTTYDYDGVGQLTKVTLPDTSFLSYTYDAAHRLTEIADSLGNKITYTLDNMGNRTAESYKDPANALTRTRSRVYDALNRLKQDIGGATPSTQISQYAYDAVGNQTSMTDPLSRTTSQTYDALNRLLNVIDPVNGSSAPTKYEYDAQDNLTKVTDPKNLATVYTYNGFNELTNQSSPDTGSTAFTYDAAGNMLTKTDARGVTATYTYDDLNRVATISYPAVGSDPAETVTYTYDGPAMSCPNGKGRLCSLVDKTGTTTWTYDLKGRVTGKTQVVSGVTQTVAYRYNAAGQMDELTLPSGKKVAYGYLNNRIVSLTYDGTSVVKSADYEPFGPVGEWTWGNDSVSSPNKHTRYFDLDGRISKIESGPTSGSGSIEPTVIVYDAASRITDLQKLTASSTVDPAKSATYGYDNLDRLTSVTPNAGNPDPARAFSYDGVGNRLTSTVSGSTTNYGYGTSSHRLNSLTGAITKTYSHDAAGNRSGDGSQIWSYGGNNRPIQVTVGGVTTSFAINALGQRVRKANSTETTRYVYDEAGRLIGEYNDSGVRIRETLWFNDLPVAVIQ